MATNTLGGVNLTRISQLSLQALTTEILPLMGMVTDFSGNAAPGGSAITTRIPSLPTVSNIAAGRASANSTTTAVTITLNTWNGAQIGFNDLERTYSDVELYTQFVQPAISVIFENVMSSVLSVFTNANHANFTVVSAANFDADAVSTLSQNLSVLKVPRANRSIICSPAYFGPLTRDNAIQSALAYGGSEAIREHRIPRLHGFNVYDYNGTIPTNSRNMAAVAFTPMSVAMAARPVVQPRSWYGSVQDIVEPISGLPMQVREFYDGSELRFEWHLNWGVAAGTPNSAWIIASS